MFRVVGGWDKNQKMHLFRSKRESAFRLQRSIFSLSLSLSISLSIYLSISPLHAVCLPFQSSFMTLVR
jgi:hypothetical protein